MDISFNPSQVEIVLSNDVRHALRIERYLDVVYQAGQNDFRGDSGWRWRDPNDQP
jgi:hypothetical protein